MKDEDVDGVKVVEGTAAALLARAGPLGTLERTFGTLGPSELRLLTHMMQTAHPWARPIPWLRVGALWFPTILELRCPSGVESRGA
jgi:hypothetical protein